MKITVWKKDSESNERLITRFTKTIQASRKIMKVRTERYFSKPKTSRYMRKAAVMREQYRANREKSRFY